MGAVTIGYLVLGGVGIVLVALSLLLGELFNLGHSDVDGPISLPAVAAFLGALGFAGVIGASVAGGTGVLAVVAGALTGLAGALPAGWLTARFSRSLAAMPTDGTLAAADLIGARGVVVSRIPTGGYGEVRLDAGGQQLKFHATADGPLAAGSAVFVVAVPSESSVVVVETTALLD